MTELLIEMESPLKLGIRRWQYSPFKREVNLPKSQAVGKCVFIFPLKRENGTDSLFSFGIAVVTGYSPFKREVNVLILRMAGKHVSFSRLSGEICELCFLEVLEWQLRLLEETSRSNRKLNK